MRMRLVSLDKDVSELEGTVYSVPRRYRSKAHDLSRFPSTFTLSQVTLDRGGTSCVLTFYGARRQRIECALRDFDLLIARGIVQLIQPSTRDLARTQSRIRQQLLKKGRAR